MPLLFGARDLLQLFEPLQLTSVVSLVDNLHIFHSHCKTVIAKEITIFSNIGDHLVQNHFSYWSQNAKHKHRHRHAYKHTHIIFKACKTVRILFISSSLCCIRLASILQAVSINFSILLSRHASKFSLSLKYMLWMIRKKR